MKHAAIDIRRPQSRRAILASQVWRLSLSLLSITGVIAPQAVMWYGMHTNGWESVSIGFNIPTSLLGVVLFSMVMAYVFGQPADIAQWSRRLSKYDGGGLCPRVLEWQRNDSTILDYCRTITASGRELLYFDYLVIEKWVQQQQEIDRRKNASEACRAIHSA